MSEISELTNEIKELRKEFKAHQKKMEPVYLWFINVNFFKKSIMWILGLASGIGGLILIIKQLFFK